MHANSKMAAIVALIAMATATAGQAQEQQRTCITRDQFRNAALFVLPDVIEGIGEVCRPALGATGNLTSEGPALIARYRALQPQAWVSARGALALIPNVPAAMRNLPDDALKPFVAGMAKQMIKQAVKPADCSNWDQAVHLLAPLPPENMAGLITVLAEAFDRDTKRKNPKNHGMFCLGEPVSITLPAPKP